METRTPYRTTREEAEKWRQPASPTIVASLALLQQELRRRGVLIVIANKPSQGQAERDITGLTWLLQYYPAVRDAGRQDG